MKQTTNGQRAAIYARVSSEQQAEVGTIASQVAALEERLQHDGLTLDPEWRFLDDGYSGSTLVRPALERLRDAVAGGAIDRLYVYSPDRLARQFACQAVLVHEFQQAGVELVFVNRPLGNTPEDQLLLQVQGVVAEYERAQILERSRRGKRHAALRGSVNVLTRAPYGYRYIRKAEGGGVARYEVVLEEARVVRQIFTWVAEERCSLREVCRRLQRQNTPSPSGRQRWDAGTLAGMLRNPTYTGTARYGKSQVGPRRPRSHPPKNGVEHPRQPYSVYDSADGGIPIPVPALVDEAVFAAVAEQLTENRRRARQQRSQAHYLLQGLLVCPDCGYAWSGRHGKGRPNTFPERHYRYYGCGGLNTARSGRQWVCPNRPARMEALDDLVWQDVCALLNDPARVAQEYQRRLQSPGERTLTRPTEAVTALLQKVKRGIGRLIDAYQDGLLDKSEFEPRLRGAKERLAQLEAEAQTQAAAQAQEEELRLVIGHLHEFSERVGSGLATADWDTRRAILQALVKKVEVGQEQVRVVYRVNTPPFAQSPQGANLRHCGSRAHRRFTESRVDSLSASLHRCIVASLHHTPPAMQCMQCMQ
jgi:site-specific DNA recombinase